MDKSSFSGPKVAAMALLAAVAIPVVSANAQLPPTTFVIDGTEGATTYANTTNGITMTLSDPAETDDGVFAFGMDSADSYSGTGELNLSSSSFGYVTAFNLAFNANVQVVSYTVGVIDNYNEGNVTNFSVTPADSFSLSIGGVPTSIDNDLSTGGSHDVAGVFVLPSGTTGTFDTNDSIDGGIVISLESITVQAVPEPRTWTLLGLGGLLVMAVRWWRRARVTA